MRFNRVAVIVVGIAVVITVAIRKTKLDKKRL